MITQETVVQLLLNDETSPDPVGHDMPLTMVYDYEDPLCVWLYFGGIDSDGPEWQVGVETMHPSYVLPAGTDPDFRMFWHRDDGDPDTVSMHLSSTEGCASFLGLARDFRRFVKAVHRTQAFKHAQTAVSEALDMELTLILNEGNHL